MEECTKCGKMDAFDNLYTGERECYHRSCGCREKSSSGYPQTEIDHDRLLCAIRLGQFSVKKYLEGSLDEETLSDWVTQVDVLLGDAPGPADKGGAAQTVPGEAEYTEAQRRVNCYLNRAAQQGKEALSAIEQKKGQTTRMKPGVTLECLYRKLVSFPGRYRAITAFADDITGLGSCNYVNSRKFSVEVYPSCGIVCVRRSSEGQRQFVTREEIEHAVKRSQEIWGTDRESGKHVYAMLIGEPLGSSGATRLFTLPSDKEKTKWGAYDGGLVPYLQRLLMVGV